MARIWWRGNLFPVLKDDFEGELEGVTSDADSGVGGAIPYVKVCRFWLVRGWEAVGPGAEVLTEVNEEVEADSVMDPEGVSYRKKTD